MREDKRRAWVCGHKDHEALIRVFLLPGDQEPPKCPKGHTMTPQPNRPYQGTERKAKA